MYTRKSRKSASYELTSLNGGASNNSLNSRSSSMSKSHQRRPSFASPDTKIVMIDENSAEDVGYVTPHTPVQNIYTSEQALLIAETGTSVGSSPMSPHSGSSGTEQPRFVQLAKSRPKRCAWPCWLFALLLSVGAALIVGFFLFKMLSPVDQTSSTVPGGFSAQGSGNFTTAPPRNATIRLPQTLDDNEHAVTSISRFTPPVDVAPHLHSKSAFGSLNVFALHDSSFLFSPLGQDFTMGLIANNTLRDSGKLSRVYFNYSPIDKINAYLNAVLSSAFKNLHFSFIDLYFFGNDPQTAKSMELSKGTTSFGDYTISNVEENDAASLDTLAQNIHSDFNRRSQITGPSVIRRALPNTLKNSSVAVDTFNFAMKFAERIDLFSTEKTIFHAHPKADLQLHKQFNHVQASKRVNDATEMLTVPLEDPRFSFFMYKGRNSNFKYTLPVVKTIDEIVAQLKDMPPLSATNVIFPHLTTASVSSLKPTLKTLGLDHLCVKFVPDSSTCSRLEDVCQIVRFIVTASGVNVPENEQERRQGDIFPQELEDHATFHADRPFFYGVWFHDKAVNQEGFVYFGTYLGKTPKSEP